MKKVFRSLNSSLAALLLSMFFVQTALADAEAPPAAAESNTLLMIGAGVVVICIVCFLVIRKIKKK